MNMHQNNYFHALKPTTFRWGCARSAYRIHMSVKKVVITVMSLLGIYFCTYFTKPRISVILYISREEDSIKGL